MCETGIVFGGVRVSVCLCVCLERKTEKLLIRKILVNHPRSGVVYNFDRVCMSVCMSVRR